MSKHKIGIVPLGTIYRNLLKGEDYNEVFCLISRAIKKSINVSKVCLHCPVYCKGKNPYMLCSISTLGHKKELLPILVKKFPSLLLEELD